MREIKFRAWYSYNGNSEMIANREVTELYDGINDYFASAESQHVVFMQFTGLKDKNGVECYEHDLVEFSKSGINYKVKAFKCRYSDELAAFVLEHGNAIFLLSDVENIEVRGNIYES